MSIILHGWPFSPFVRAVRIALEEKAAPYRIAELTPAALGDNQMRTLNPFGRVPVFEQGQLVLIETPAILRYVDESMDGPALQPADPTRRALMEMLLLVTANYFYPTGVMGVFFGDVYVRENGGMPDPAKLATAADQASVSLGFIDQRMVGPHLVGDISLADTLLAPMIHYFQMSAVGRTALTGYPRLSKWFTGMAERPSFQTTTLPVPKFGL